jgi:Aspartyl protease
MTRPAMPVDVLGAGGILFHRRFLVDSCADHTVLSAALLNDLGLPASPPPPALTFQGVGGTSPFVVISTVLEFARDDGGTARVRGQFVAFTDPQATDMSILGRDVLDHFDVIISRRRNEVLLLAPTHHYVVIGP